MDDEPYEPAEELNLLAKVVFNNGLDSERLPAYLADYQRDTGREPAAQVRLAVSRIARDHAAGIKRTSDETAAFLWARAETITDALESEAFAPGGIERVSARQSGGLVAQTQRLAALTGQAKTQDDVACLATATILVAASALDTLLSDYVYIMRPNEPGNRGYSKMGLAEKRARIEAIVEVDGEILANVAALWDFRNAIGHSEAESKLAQKHEACINKKGAHWAARTVEAFALALWKSEMPGWLCDDMGRSC